MAQVRAGGRAMETGADMRWHWMAVVATLSVGVAGCDYVPDYVRALFQNKAISGKVYEKGTFKGDLDVRFMSVVSGDGRRVELFQLLAPFGYKDAKGVDWDVPAGFLSDGASIPVELWAVLGGPFSGPYRDAAVVHDYFCWAKNRKWEDVHEVFAEAAAKRGTSESLTKVLYAGVLFGGPRWPAPKSGALDVQSRIMKAQAVPTPSPAPAPPLQGKSDKEVFDDLKGWIEKEKPTFDQIRQRIEEIRKAQSKPAAK